VSSVSSLGNLTPACRWQEVPGAADLAALHAFRPDRYPHLLESVARGNAGARYDILFAFPEKRLILTGAELLDRERSGGSFDFLTALDRDWQRYRIDSSGKPPFPFHGGWFLYLGYELARELEPSLHGIPIDADYPVALADRIPAAIIYDHLQQITWVLCEHGREDLLTVIERDLLAHSRDAIDTTLPAILQIFEEEPALHYQRVQRTLDYIRAGDTFQVNLSRGWKVELATPPPVVSVYAQLRTNNPAPFAGFATIGPGRAVVSSSPERLVAVHHGRIETRPIAGTRPRLVEEGNDRQQRAALVTNPKERAEHVMLVDLERNDLGRVCIPGSIEVDDLLVVESYQHVHHLVSGVSGILRPGISPGQVIRGLFPGGTITGCPKIRTMQIIAELENEPRRAYTGSMGYLNRDGSLDLNILIRTLQVDGNWISFRAGGGIVADSDPERELDETRAKAKGLLSMFRQNGPRACTP
jgi:anthranilate synthase component 1